MRQEGGDDLPTKLVKYIPGETLAFFVPAAALVGSERDGLLWAIALVGAVGTVAWLWYASRSEPIEKRPRAHFFGLAVIAYAVWALATAPNLGELVRVDEVTAGVILMFGVFLIPVIDGILNSLTPAKMPGGQGVAQQPRVDDLRGHHGNQEGDHRKEPLAE
ncbi:MAG TPA: hypothetical protein VFY84_07360 [Jiangellales bacterium]|nr:hypothetical protein [Jiangellales bacterium]